MPAPITGLHVPTDPANGDQWRTGGANTPNHNQETENTLLSLLT
jgi:hypothetical protein